MNENRVRKNIRRLLFEDNWISQATDDKSAGKFVVDSDEEFEQGWGLCQWYACDIAGGVSERLVGEEQDWQAHHGVSVDGP